MVVKVLTLFWAPFDITSEDQRMAAFLLPDEDGSPGSPVSPTNTTRKSRRRRQERPFLTTRHE